MKPTRKTVGATIGERTRARREFLNVKQAALADAVGMTVPKLSELEHGKSKRGPSGETLSKLASALGLTVADLLPKSKVQPLTSQNR